MFCSHILNKQRCPRGEVNATACSQMRDLQTTLGNRSPMEVSQDALKARKMMSKNLNGITIQIYAILIVYLILQLYAYGTATPIEIPRIYGSK